MILGLIVVGVGAAVLTPASLAIVTDSFRGERRGMAVGAWGAATALFSGIGPAIGGVLTQEISWRWILWLNVIVGVMILAGARGATESFDEAASRRIDYTGLALSAAGLLPASAAGIYAAAYRTVPHFSRRTRPNTSANLPAAISRAEYASR